MRRTLIMISLAIVLLGLGVVAYFYFFQDTPGVEVAPQGSTLPIAGSDATPFPTDTTGTTTDGGAPGTSVSSPVAVTARFVQISPGPVVPGEVVVNRGGESASSTPETLVAYIERRSGNAYTYSLQARTITRTSNRTIPGIQSAAWLPNGSLAFVRYLSGASFSLINTYGLPASGSGGFFLSQNLAEISVSSTSVLTLSSGVNGSTASLARIDGSRSATVFSTPLSSLRVSFLGKSQYLAFTKPSVALLGNAFVVDAAGRFSRIAGPLQGLVALASPSGNWLLVSYTLAGAMQMELVNVGTGEILQLPVATIADKCVWTLDESSVYCGVPQNPPVNAAYPDDWYQGAIRFSDRLWRLQIAGRYAQLVLDVSKEANGSVDIQAPAIDPRATVFVFMNKNDGSLWSYSL